eukprot:TRINITY_DN9449_c0_g1_i2.p1 TRINITY_DN9449_c0_g1~~TRINITY_DN9449_c0_g1_i2.p1  ORF type:complete len:1180 (+),score=297.27 TRINITY_DN9449_c0_g1_i2:344-3883(+)
MDVWELSLASVPWHWERRLSTGPPPRAAACAWRVGAAVLVFGGRPDNGSPPHGDFWAYDARLAEWQAVRAHGEPPPARSRAACFTASGGALGVWGGEGAAALLGDLWTYDPKAQRWEQHSPQGAAPPARAGIAAASQDSTGLVFVFSGEPAGGVLPSGGGDLWVLNTAASPMHWALRSPGSAAGPAARSGYALGFASSPARLILTGGEGAAGLLGDLWVFHLGNSSWTAGGAEMSGAGGRAEPLPKRARAAAAVVGGRLYLFGGMGEVPSGGNSLHAALRGDLLAVALATEAPSQIHPTPALPTPRADHSAVQHGAEMWVYGGTSGVPGEPPLSDLWRYDLLSLVWTRIDTVPGQVTPPGRHSHAAVAYRGRMLVLGGEGRGGTLGDVWALDFASHLWAELRAPAGTPPPPPRSGAAMVHVGQHMFVYGGISFGRPAEDLWRFDVERHLWSQIGGAHLEARGGPGRLAYYAMVSDAGGFTITGGLTEALDATGRVVHYNLSEQRWLQRPGLPLPVAGHAALTLSGAPPPRTLVIGGSRHGMAGPSSAALQMSQFSSGFEEYIPPAALLGVHWFGGLSAHTAVGFLDRVVLFGGRKATGSGLLEETLTSSEVWVLTLQPLCHRGAVQLDCWGCSPGAEHLRVGFDRANDTCVPCAPGSYSDSWGGRCEPCPAGRAGRRRAASASWQCEPCPAGTYQPLPGSVGCLPCPTGLDCSISSSRPQQPNTPVASDSHPQPLPDEMDKVFRASVIAAVTGVVASVGIIAVFIGTQRTKLGEVWRLLDMFLSTQHDYADGAFVTALKTPHGGALSLVVLAAFAGLAAAVIIPPAWQNEYEWRALLPSLVADAVPPTSLTAAVRFRGFKGECDAGALCAPGVSVAAANLTHPESYRVRCDTDAATGDCEVVWECSECGVHDTTARLTFTLDSEELEEVSCTAVEWTVGGDAGYPGQRSAVTRTILPPPAEGAAGARIFKGVRPPSEAWVVLTPTVWSHFHTGRRLYGRHAQFARQAPGSTVDSGAYERHHGLEFVIHLEQRSSILLVSVDRNQAPVVVVAVCIGLLPGLILLMSGAMQVHGRCARQPALAKQQGPGSGPDAAADPPAVENGSFAQPPPAAAPAEGADSAAAHGEREAQGYQQQQQQQQRQRATAKPQPIRDIYTQAEIGHLGDAQWRHAQPAHQDHED